MLKKHRKRYCRFFCIPLIAAVLLTGCGIGAENATEESPPEESASLSTDQDAGPQNTKPDGLWYLTEYHDNWVTTYESDYDRQYYWLSCAREGTVYLNNRYSRNDEVIHSMDSFNVQEAQSFHMELDLSDCGLPGDELLSGMDRLDDKQMVLLFRSEAENDMPLPDCSLVFYHTEDGMQKTLDLLPALTAAGKEKGPVYAVRCDADGRIYLSCKNALLIISETGELLCSAQWDQDAPLLFLCKNQDGSPLYMSPNKAKRTNTYWGYDNAAGEMCSLGESEFVEMNSICMDSNGNLYYLSDENIVRWDTRSGSRENIFNYKNNQLFSNSNSKVMTIRENGDLAILDCLSDGLSIYVLSPNPPTESRTLTLVNTSLGDSIVTAAASLFSMKRPGVTIEISDFNSSGSDDVEAYTTNLINRIVAGDAPDMFVISAETMYTLYEKGALADLTDSIPKDTREQVFGCVWNAGTIDGKLTGLATKISTHSILVSDEVWAQDIWRLEDILELADSAPAGTLRGIICTESSSPSAVLYRLALRDIDSCLVDREAGICHFDSDIFRRLLEYCKTTSQNQNSGTAEAVMEGDYLAYAYDFYFGFTEFSTQTSRFPENYHWIGVPTDGVSGNLIYAKDFLVVSKDTENMDLISEFLPFIYGDELTRLYPEFCLRRDVLRRRVLDANEYRSSAEFDMGGGVYRVLECKPDGTAYTEDYITFMDSCVLEPPEDSAIASIVLEEVEPYFSGNKDINTVIDIIQSRVQIYLNENGS